VLDGRFRANGINTVLKLICCRNRPFINMPPKKLQPRKKSKKVKVSGKNRPKTSLPGSMTNYLAMLSDPCAGPFELPPYGSTDSGYLVRTVELLVIQGTTGYSGLTTGALTPIDFILQYTPTAYTTSGNNGLCYNGAKVGQNQVATSQTSTAWPVNNTAVQKFRPIAGCVKVLPNGSYNNRQGTIAVGYSSGQMFNAGATLGSATAIQPLLMEIAPTGSKKHEARWLPTAVDALWSSPGTYDNVNAGGGTIVISGAAVDGVALSASVVQANVNVEVTTLWEWTPAYNTSISNIPRTPSPYTINDVLSRVKDIAGFVLGTYLKTMDFIENVDYGTREYRRMANSVPLLSY
jgi:hypothetical protein